MKKHLSFVTLATVVFGLGCTDAPKPAARPPSSYWQPPSSAVPTVAPKPAFEPSAMSERRVAEPTTASADSAHQPTTGPGNASYIVADHQAAAASVPACWLKRGARIRVVYQHTSHGSQIVSGLKHLAKVGGANYALGEPNGLALTDGMTNSYAEKAPDLGYDGWFAATKAYLKVNPSTNAVMWSWCGQVGSHVSDMQQYLFAPAKAIVESHAVRFIFMTGHLDGGGPKGETWLANELIRKHVRATNGILFDFADIETHDPGGKAYPSGSDGCEWCTSWCANHPGDCRSLPECAHSHGLNCVRKGQAYWWLVARMAGWSGDPNQEC